MGAVEIPKLTAPSPAVSFERDCQKREMPPLPLASTLLSTAYFARFHTP